MKGQDDRHPDELISALYDGELAPEEWVAVKEHLEGCRRCRQLLEEIKSISGAMPADPPVPEGLAARVKERLPAGAGRQRPLAPRREPMPYKPTRRRITFPLAAGAGLAAALIVGALLIQYVPSSMLSRLRLPPAAAEEGAEEGAGRTAAGGAKEQESIAAKGAPEASSSAEPAGEAGLPAEPGPDASAGAVVPAMSEATQQASAPPPEAKGEATGSGAGTAAIPPAEFAAAGERPGLAPGQELPVTVPEEADEPARSAEETRLDATPRIVGGVEGAATAVANEVQVPTREEKDLARRAQEAVPPPAAAKTAAAPPAPAVAPPSDAGAPLGRAAEAAPVASAASVADCRATWGAPRQANWPPTAGGNPERTVGGAGKAAGGKSIVLENPRRVRVTVTRGRWPELLQRLAAAGVTGTSQLPAPPAWADCASVNVSVPEAPAASPSPAPPAPEAPPPPPPAA